jgi:hypothetical protein
VEGHAGAANALLANAEGSEVQPLIIIAIHIYVSSPHFTKKSWFHS